MKKTIKTQTISLGIFSYTYTSGKLLILMELTLLSTLTKEECPMKKQSKRKIPTLFSYTYRLL